MTQSSASAGSDSSDVSLAKLPLVSVVVTSYNHAAFLRDCLRSVVAQSYPHLQLIVVDNASTDGSQAVIRDFAESLPGLRADIALTPVFSQVNGHEVGAVVTAFPYTRGSYLAFIDGDDLLLPDCIATHVKAHLVSRIAVGMTSVDMYQSVGSDIVVATGETFSRYVMSKRGQAEDFCRMANLEAFAFPGGPAAAPLTPADLHYVPPSMAHDWVWSPSTGLCFRREAVALMLDPAPMIRAGADNYLARGVIGVSGAITIDRPLAVYRMHGANMFTRHPTLANFHAFDPSQNTGLDLDVMNAIIECYRRRAPDLARLLVDPDLFIQAIDQFCSVKEARGARGRRSSLTLEFLVDHRDELVRAFGAGRYDKWLARRLRMRDRLDLLRSRLSMN